MSDKFLPHVIQVREASRELPDAELWPGDEFIVELKGSNSSHMITFKRTTFKSRTKGKTYKWIYEGKVMVS